MLLFILHKYNFAILFAQGDKKMNTANVYEDLYIKMKETILWLPSSALIMD